MAALIPRVARRCCPCGLGLPRASQLRAAGLPVRLPAKQSAEYSLPRSTFTARSFSDLRVRASPERNAKPSRPATYRALLAAGSGAFALLLTLLELPGKEDVTAQASPPAQAQPDGDQETNDANELRYYRLEEVRQHGKDSERPWIIYGDRIYDITEWVPAHPGGDVILRAAGGHIEPYWDIFAIHKSQYVRDILDQYVIGQIHPEDLAGNTSEQIEDPFASDPPRDERLQLLTQKPCNAETPGEELADSFLTPNETFYVRNHMWVPSVDNGDEHEISIELPSGEVKTYTVRDLKTRFRQHTVTAVLQCSGNRRKNMTEGAKKTNGLQWTVGAISCAKWEGVRLRDLLADAGFDFEPSEDAQHVQFSGAEAYGASIPITSAIDPRGDVLLAMRMNDKPLPADHGFPLRVIVPGHVAARCVKWLRKIVVSDEESSTSWQRKDYKCFGPNEVKQDWDKYKSIQKMPITSAITRTKLVDSKEKSATVQPAVLQVEGYAYSGGGHEIQRVDISLDGGKTWDQASLIQADKDLEHGSQAWCWKRWKYTGEVPGINLASPAGHSEQKASIVVKATDDAYNTQPEHYDSIYNLRGNLATAWHRVEMNYKGNQADYPKTSTENNGS